VDDDRQPRCQARVALGEEGGIKQSQAENAEGVKSAGHSRGRYRGPDHGQENVRDQEEIGNRDVVGEEKNPIEKGDPEPNRDREEDINQDIAQGMKELEAVDEFVEEVEDLSRPSLGNRPQDDGRDAQRPFLEKVKEKAQDEERRGECGTDDPPAREFGVSLGLDAEDRFIERPGQEKYAEKKAHREHVEDAFDDDRPDDEPRPDIFLAGHVERLDDFPDPSRENVAHGEPDGIARDEIGEFHLFFLVNEEVAPAKGPDDQVEGRQEDDDDKPAQVGPHHVAEGVGPSDAPESEIKENSGQEKDQHRMGPFLCHRRPSILSKA